MVLAVKMEHGTSTTLYFAQVLVLAERNPTVAAVPAAAAAAAAAALAAVRKKGLLQVCMHSKRFSKWQMHKTIICGLPRKSFQAR